MRHFLLLILLPLALFAKSPSLAVEDFASRGVSKDEAAIISDRLREALVQTGKVRVLEREEMHRILKEQAFQQSGACDQSECAVKIGRLLAVDRMVVGTVGRIGSLYTLGARLLDVGTGEVLFTASRDNEGQLEELLLVGVPDIAARLAEGAQTTARGKTSEGGRADLEVSIDDSTAVLRLDGRPVPGRSPFLLEGIESGAHRLDARTATRQGSAMVDLEDDAVVKVDLRLDTGTTAAKFYSEPSKADVYLDEAEPSGFPVGRTPLRLDSLVVGGHRVTFRRDGFLDTTLSVEALLGTTTTTRVKLVRGAALVLVPAPNVPIQLVRGRDTIRTTGTERIPLREGRWTFALSHPLWESAEHTFEIRSGRDDTIWLTPHFARLRIRSDAFAKVLLDGVALGTTPLDLGDIEPGFRTLVLQAEGKSDWTQPVHLHSGEELAVDARMESRFAWLRVHSNIRAEVELDGRAMGFLDSDSARAAARSQALISGFIAASALPKGFSWSSDTLAPGPHRLRVRAEKRVPWETDVTLTNGSGMTFEALLPWTQEELARRDRQRRGALRYLFGTITVVSAVATTWMGCQWNADLDRAHRIQAEYDAARSGFPEIKARYDQSRSDVAGDRTGTVVAAAVTAIGAAGFGLTWAF